MLNRIVKTRLRGAVRAVALCAMAPAILWGCGDGRDSSLFRGRDSGAEQPGQRLLVMEQPPSVAAESRDGLEALGLLLRRLPEFGLENRSDARFVGVEELPFLRQSPAGRAFSAIEGARVLVRGEPAAYCPVAMAVPVPEGARVETTLSALRACIDRLATPDCGCRVLAMDNTALVPRTDLTYAGRITVRAEAPALGLDGLLVAEEGADGTETLYDLTGPVGTVSHDGDRVDVRIGGRTFSGTRRLVGFRRGRLAQRVYATDETGARIALLIGFDPDEIAQFAGGWLAWPEGT